MKELNEIKQDQLQVSEVKTVNKTVYLGSLKIHKGHTCFQLHMPTGKVTIAKIETVTATPSKVLKGEYKVGKKVIREADCIYVTALNEENAKKKFLKIFKRATNETIQPKQ